ncbi:hypothetical protein [Rhodococcus sp. BS-15]|uniref:hypothetical protein n=1 Tax=Rhodococcus sp. BS-15 TaxID=1304954 RepID=UPI001F3861FE|nr:hypothetical protein [Rhodococcus sp. BS-15]
MSDVVEVPPRSSTGRVLSVVVGISVAVSALGGMLWGFLAPAQQLLVVAQDRGAALTGESLHRFDGLALFSFVSLALGLVLPIGSGSGGRNEVRGCSVPSSSALSQARSLRSWWATELLLFGFRRPSTLQSGRSSLLRRVSRLRWC